MYSPSPCCANYADLQLMTINRLDDREYLILRLAERIKKHNAANANDPEIDRFAEALLALFPGLSTIRDEEE